MLPARKPALIAAAVAVVLLCALGVLFAGRQGPTALDQSAFDAVRTHVPYAVLHLLKAPTNPVLLITVLAVVVLVALAARRFDLAVLAVAGPALSVGLASLVLKHVFGRRYYGGYLAYPSGHTTALTSTLLVVLIAVALPRRTALTIIAIVIAVIALIAGVIGLVGLQYHYLTDTFGGFFLACATVVVIASVLDNGGIRHSHGGQERRGAHSVK